MLTRQDLIRYGFKEFISKSLIDNYDVLYQYTVRDSNNNRVMFVNVRFWENSKYPGGSDGFDAYCQLELIDGKIVNLLLHSVSQMQPVEIVEWFQNIFEKLDAKPYDARNS